MDQFVYQDIASRKFLAKEVDDKENRSGVVAVAQKDTVKKPNGKAIPALAGSRGMAALQIYGWNQLVWCFSSDEEGAFALAVIGLRLLSKIVMRSWRIWSRSLDKGEIDEIYSPKRV